MRKEFVISKYKFYIIYFAVWAYYACILPYGHDDWVWGSKIGIERLVSGFEGYNGRYLGNLIVLALTRSILLKTLLMAFMIGMIPILIKKITRCELNFFVSLFLILVMPIEMFAMTVAWVAGFSNYVVSAFFTLTCILYIFTFLEKMKEAKQDLGIGMLLLILGFCSTLVVEHVTLYIACLSVGLIIYVFIRQKKIYIQHILFSIGCVAGTFIMFSNSAYHKTYAGEDPYRSMFVGGIIRQAYNNYFKVAYKFFFYENMWINILFAIVCWVLWRNKDNNTTNRIKYFLRIYTVLFGWCIFEKLSLNDNIVVQFEKIDGCLSFILLGCQILILLMIFQKTSRFEYITFLIASKLFICSILLCVNPLSARCFFITYIIDILLLALLIKEIIDRSIIGKQTFCTINKMLYVGIMVTTTVLLVIYSMNCYADIKRKRNLFSQIQEGLNTVEIKRLPFENFQRNPTPDKNRWSEGVTGYKLMYGISKDIEIVTVD